MESELPTENDLLSSIYIVRGLKVIPDFELARIYGVTTARLNEQFRRNRKRFPADFAFELTHQEFTHLMSQNAISSRRHGGRRKPVTVFTEHGAIMLATVLNSRIAVAASVHVVRAFIYLREAIGRNKQVQEKLAELEQRLNLNDAAVSKLFDAIRELVGPVTAAQKRREIGFHVKDSAVGI